MALLEGSAGADDAGGLLNRREKMPWDGCACACACAGCEAGAGEARCDFRELEDPGCEVTPGRMSARDASEDDADDVDALDDEALDAMEMGGCACGCACACAFRLSFRAETAAAIWAAVGGVGCGLLSEGPAISATVSDILWRL